MSQHYKRLVFKFLIRVTGVFGLVFMSAIQLQAAPMMYIGTGNYYEFIPGNISWDAANTAAQASLFNSTSGHLATVSSQGENDFIRDLLVGVNNSVWLGGNDVTTEGTWNWVSGEKFFEGDKDAGTSFLYTNWNSREPNNFNNDENYLSMFGLDVVTKLHPRLPGEWNDLPLNGQDPSKPTAFTIGGYVVEYDSAEPVPEPSTATLLAGGLLILGMVRRRS